MFKNRQPAEQPRRDTAPKAREADKRQVQPRPLELSELTKVVGGAASTTQLPRTGGW